ncbi:unnamed protein product [Adineta ricciae]|uniref:F-box domain-containing protein n=1 Tax=Adineta ricciae TaxID=249248 RepID=A0A815PS52_ADIRI|nr:unnamed protein product [Adineta ricciae]
MACLEDLPDELIIFIWNKLSTVDLLGSFIGVNRRFDKLIWDVNYTRSIELIDKNSNQKYCSLPDPLLNKLCSCFLPEIQENIECLTLEPYSMERILSAGQYPHLYKLILVNFGHQSTRRYFTDQSSFLNLFKQKVTCLKISIDDAKLKLLLVTENENLYALISFIFPQLTDFTFTCHPFWRRYAHLTIDESCQSSSFLRNIVNLSIDVDTLDDCFRLLGGRLNYLREFIIRIYKIQPSTLVIDNKVLHNLRCFSLSSSKTTSAYDSSILPLLQRMISLEKLMLNLSINRTTTFLDGFHFKDKIFSYMTRLQRFDFEIETSIQSNEQTNVEIQTSFSDDSRYGQVISYINYKPYGNVKCHIFSLPYTMNETLAISSHFSEGFIPNVRSLTLIDTNYSFEHQFFMKISQSFPYLAELCIVNSNAQKHTDSNQLIIIEFPYLNKLTLLISHLDYSEQFLVDTNIRLLRLSHLTISYEHLVIVTEHFTRDATRRNCAQLNYIHFFEQAVHSEDFYRYFPLLK